MSSNDAVTEAGRIADSLGFTLNDEDLRAAIEAADELAKAAAAVTDDPDPTMDATDRRRLDDAHGALLWGYEDPRVEDDGPLTGLDIAVKDNVAAAGLPLTCGTEGLSYTPTFDATLVERLLTDGASLVGKANMDAFAFGPSGEFSDRRTVRNPLDAERVPGGSSSGSGVAVATGTVDAAIGTDTGGSVRIPAACCGVVGIKPTTGTVSRHGIVPFAPSLDTAGPLASTVEDARRVLESIRGHDPADASTGVPDGKREIQLERGADEELVVGVPRSFCDVCSATVRDSVDAAVAELSTVATVEEIALPLGAIEEAYLLVGATEFSWWLRQAGTVRGVGSTYDEEWSQALSSFLNDSGISEHIAKRVLPSAYLDTVENGEPYRAARREARAFAGRVDEALVDIDVLCVPTIRTLPPERGKVTANARLFDLLGNTAPFNLSGHPAVSLPVDGGDGLPVSVQLVAPRGADDRAIDAATVLADVVADSDRLSPPALPV